MSRQIRYRCNACGETFDFPSGPQNLPLNCPACESDDLLHVPGNRPLDNLTDRFGDSALLKILKAGALLVAILVAILFSLYLLLWVICFGSTG